MSTQTLSDAVARLAILRQKQGELAAVMKAKKVTFDATIAWLVEEKKANDAETAVAEKEVQALALAHFGATQERKPADGVEIKEFNVISYSAADAFEWAKKSGLALKPESLDEPAFEKIANATPLPFVTYGKEPRAQIAKNLPVPEPQTTTVAEAKEPF